MVLIGPAGESASRVMVGANSPRSRSAGVSVRESASRAVTVLDPPGSSRSITAPFPPPSELRRSEVSVTLPLLRTRAHGTARLPTSPVPVSSG